MNNYYTNNYYIYRLPNRVRQLTPLIIIIKNQFALGDP